MVLLTTTRFQTLIGTVKTSGVPVVAYGSNRFQTLIGTVKTVRRWQRVKAPEAVSNPHRYGQNGLVATDTLHQKVFQTLIGTVKTRLVKGGHHAGRIGFKPS